MHNNIWLSSSLFFFCSSAARACDFSYVLSGFFLCFFFFPWRASLTYFLPVCGKLVKFIVFFFSVPVMHLGLEVSHPDCCHRATPGISAAWWLYACATLDDVAFEYRITSILYNLKMKIGNKMVRSATRGAQEVFRSLVFYLFIFYFFAARSTQQKETSNEERIWKRFWWLRNRISWLLVKLFIHGCTYNQKKREAHKLRQLVD